MRLAAKSRPRAAPPAPASGATYVRHTPRRELDIAVVGVASRLDLQDGRCVKARIVLGAVAPTPVRATEAEALLEGQALSPELLERAGKPYRFPDDDRRGQARTGEGLR